MGIIVIFVALLVSIGVPVVLYLTAERVSGGRIAGMVLSAVGGLLLFVAAFGFTEIGAGQVGIVTSFGKVQEETLQPGLSWRVPFITAVTVMDTRVQSYAFDNIEAFTSENQPALLSGIVNYHIDPETASALYQTVGVDYPSKLISPQADSALKQDARSYGVDAITAKRDQLAGAAMAKLTEVTAPYGITIDSVSIRNIDLSKDYLSSVEGKQKALQDVERARAEAESARQRAHGEADAQVIVAQGQADANAKVAASLTGALIQWQYVQKLAPNVTVMMVPSGDGLLLNLPVPTPATQP